MVVCPEIEAKRKISSDSRDIILNHENGEVHAAGKESYLKKYIVSPFIFALEVLRKPRDSSTKRLVYLQIFNCTLYWFVMEEQNMLYFYMARRFDGFDGTDFALYTMIIKVLIACTIKIVTGPLPNSGPLFQVVDSGIHLYMAGVNKNVNKYVTLWASNFLSMH